MWYTVFKMENENPVIIFSPRVVLDQFNLLSSVEYKKSYSTECPNCSFLFNACLQGIIIDNLICKIWHFTPWLMSLMPYYTCIAMHRIWICIYSNHHKIHYTPLVPLTQRYHTSLHGLLVLLLLFYGYFKYIYIYIYIYIVLVILELDQLINYHLIS